MTNEMVLERKSNLVMPSHYVELDREEMSYVEGGGILTAITTGIKVLGAVASVLRVMHNEGVIQLSSAALTACNIAVAAASILQLISIGSSTVTKYIVKYGVAKVAVALGVSAYIVTLALG